MKHTPLINNEAAPPSAYNKQKKINSRQKPKTKKEIEEFIQLNQKK